jgi:hypothetical protein
MRLSWFKGVYKEEEVEEIRTLITSVFDEYVKVGKAAGTEKDANDAAAVPPVAIGLRSSRSLFDSFMDFGSTPKGAQVDQQLKSELVRYLDDWEGDACGMGSEHILPWWKVCIITMS